jgi:WD40 repeat protein
MSHTYLSPQPDPHCFLGSLVGQKPCSWQSLKNIVVGMSYDRKPTTTTSIRWNNSGSKLLTGGADQTVRLYDPEQAASKESKDLKPVSEYKGHTLGIHQVAFNHPDSEF